MVESVLSPAGRLRSSVHLDGRGTMAAVTSFSLGQTPHRMTLVISPGADFVATLSRSDNVNWPAGTTVQIVVDAHPAWVGTVTGPSIAWEIDELVVTPIANGSPKKAKLYHTLAGTKVLWASGPVVVR